MIIGITGTRHGMTPAQRAALPGLIAVLPERVLHGGAVGVDEEVDAFLAPLYARRYPDGLPSLVEMIRSTTTFDTVAYVESLPIRVYPVGIARYNHWRFEAPFTELRLLFNPDENPLHRNCIIAEGSDHLLAFLATAEECRSGTWATVRYARSVRKPITIVGPDGSIREERP